MSGFLGNDAARRFTEFADECLKSFFEFMPPQASNLGLHEYDGRTPDLSKEAIEKRIEEMKQSLAELKDIDPSQLDLDTRLDYDLLRQGLESELFSWAEQREHTYNPMLGMWLTDITAYI